MDDLLISRSCTIRKPSKPKRGSSSKYKKIWELLEGKIYEYHVAKHQALIDDVCVYLRDTPKGPDILTAALRLGSNVSDQSGIFVELASQLCESTQLICRLTPADCASLTTIITRLFNDFVDSLCVDDAPKLKKSLLTFGNIVEIFKLITRKKSSSLQGSPRKRKNSLPRIQGNKLIIIIEDVTAIKANILEDFSLIVKNHLDDMEVCFVFGISSTAQSIQKLLSFKCSSCLSIRTFTSPAVSETLAGIFDLLVFNREFPFKLSPEVFYWLSGFVLDHDFSLTTLLQILRVALTLHLQRVEKPVLKALINGGTDASIDGAVEKHNQAHLALEDLAKAIVTLANCKGVVFKDSYLALQQKDFLTSEIFKRLENSVKFLSTDELLLRLQKYIEDVEEGDIADEFVDLCARLMQDDLEDNLAEEGDTDISKVKSRFELMDKMRLAAQKKRTTKLDIVREDVIKLIKSRVENLKRPQDLDNYDDIYIGNAKKLAALFTPGLRSRLNQALSVPSSILNCACCKVQPTDMSIDLPPLSVVYKLHLECGKMINMYDWLQSYQVVKEDNTNVSIAYFLRAVRELQVLGYVKPTTRKTDHVQRLTWGSC